MQLSKDFKPYKAIKLSPSFMFNLKKKYISLKINESE